MLTLLKSITILSISLFLNGCITSDSDSSGEIVSDGKSYTIGGSVSDQEGEGLVLQLSAGNEVKLDRGGEFTFPNEVLSGEKYKISIVKQPIDPVQECRVITPTFGEGIMPISNIANVSIVCDFRWTKPVSFDENISLDVGIPTNYEVAMNNDGDVIIVWLQSNGTHSQVYKSEYRDGKWLHPSGIEDSISISGSDAFYPKVALNDHGIALITWYQIDDLKQQYLFKSEYLDNSWSHPKSLNDSFSFPIESDDKELFNPEVALNIYGEGIIVWAQNNGNHDQVYKSQLSSKVWTHPDSITDHISVSGSKTASHKVALSDNGHAVIAWQQAGDPVADKGTQQIFVSEYRGTEWINPKDLKNNVSFGPTNARSPVVAINNIGHTVVAWVQSDGDNEHIYKRQYWRTENKDVWEWYEQEALDETERVSIPGAHADKPVVKVNDNDEAVLVWQSNKGAADFNLFFVRFRGGGWTGVTTPRSSFTFHLTTSEVSSSARSANVALSNEGRLVITWLQVGEGYNSLLKAVFSSAGDRVIPSTIEDSTSFGGWIIRDANKAKIAGSQIVQCKNAEEIIEVDDEKNVTSHSLICDGIEETITVDSIGGKVELGENGNPISFIAQCNSSVKNKLVDVENSSTSYTIKCEGAVQKILADEAYNSIQKSGKDVLKPMSVAGEGKVALANNGDGIIVWSQQTTPDLKTDIKLFTSEIRTQTRTSKYSIGGVVAGLVGSGLVLQNNNEDDLTIIENGSFRFLNRLKQDETYSVSVKQHPTNPRQICNVKNSFNTVARGNISTVYVSCENDISNATVVEVAAIDGGNFVGATIDDEDNIYISDRNNSRIVKYDADGTLTTLVDNITFIQNSAELMVSGDNLYFVNNASSSGSVFHLDLSLPIDSSTSPVPLSWSENLINISDIATDDLGSLYVSMFKAQEQSAKVLKITAEGVIADPKFSEVDGNWLTLTNNQENIYISERDKISQINKQGNKSTIMAGLDEPLGLFYKNESIYFIDNEKVYKVTPHLGIAEQLFDRTKLPEIGNVRLLVNSQNQVLLLSNNKIWRVENN